MTFDIPAQVDVMNSGSIASQTTSSLGKILSNEAGVNNLSTGSQAGKPVIRGMNGERIKVLSNGSATDFQTYGIRHISNTDPYLANSIEVIRGAQGVLYCSDALGGIVNILSPQLLYAKEGETKLQGEVMGEYHTNNDERAGGFKLQSALGKVGLNLSVVKRKSGNIHTPDSDTWQVGESAGTLPRFAGELPYTNFESTAAQMALGYTDNWGKVALEHTYWQSFQNYLGHIATSPYNAVASAGQDLSNNETQFRGEFLMDEWIIKPTLSHTQNHRQAATNVAYELMNSNNIDLDIEVDRLDTKLALVHPQIGIFEGELGVEGYEKEQSVEAGHLVPDAHKSAKAIYLFEEANLGQWVGQWGVRYDTKKVDPSDHNAKEFSAFGGSLGATYKFTTEWNLALNLSRGFRAPSIFELYADGVHGGVQAYQAGNENLDEEISSGGDLSLRYKSEKTKASLTFYRTYIKNYIYLANTGYYRNSSGTSRSNTKTQTTPLPEMTNQQTSAQMQGVEFSLETYLREATRLKSTLELIDGRDEDNNHDLTILPANNLTLALYHDIGKLANFNNNIFSLNVKMVDE